MNITEEVNAVLDEQLIGHATLKVNTRSKSKHHIVTDQKQVYVKILRDPNPNSIAAKKLKAEVDFAFNTGYGTNPLLEQIYYKNSKGHNLIMSAWEYEQQVPLSYNLNPIQVAQSALALFNIHSCPQYDALRYDTAVEYDEYTKLFTSHSFLFLNASHQNKIKALFENVIQPAMDSMTMNPKLNVVSHGQARLNKIIPINNNVQWVDYEEVRSAPREYDAASMFIQLHHHASRPDLWELFRFTYEEHLGRPLNEELLQQFITLALARKALTLASTTLYTMNDEALKGFLNQLNKLISGKKRVTEIDYSYFR